MRFVCVLQFVFLHVVLWLNMHVLENGTLDPSRNFPSLTSTVFMVSEYFDEPANLANICCLHICLHEFTPLF